MNISYLIENTNHVFIDNKLLEDYQKQGVKQAPAPIAQPPKSKSPRDHIKRPAVNSNPKNKSPSGEQKRKDIIYKVPSNKTNFNSNPTCNSNAKPGSQVFTEAETVEILSAKIAEIQARQANIQAQYGTAIDKLQS